MRKDEAARAAAEIKTLGDIVGMPDDADKRNLENLLKAYDKAFPGEIAAHIRRARVESQGLKNEWGTSQTHLGFHQGIRRALIMPIGLMRKIEEAYPLMFTDRKHMHWFQRNFPLFNVAQRGHNIPTPSQRKRV